MLQPYDFLAVMRRRLAETGLYTPDGTTLADCELAAYAVGMTLLLQQMQELERELFLPTAQDWGLTLWEGTIGVCRHHLDAAQRRSLLLAYLAVSPADCTAVALERQLDSLGITAQVTEQMSAGVVTVAVTDVSRLANPSEEAVQALAKRFLPLHLTINWDFSAV